MNYYEELGISASASAEEIKESYWSLMRLLHPDHQPEGDLRRVAELQVKRLNQVYATLSDADRRWRYDQSLVEPHERIAPIIVHQPPPPPNPFFQRSSIAWIAAVCVFAILLIWMASHETTVTPAYRESGASLVEPQPAPPRVAEPVRATQPTQAPAAVASPPTPVPENKTPSNNTGEAERLRLRLAQVLSERDAALGQVAQLQARLSSVRASNERVASKSSESRRSTAPELAEQPSPPARQQPPRSEVAARVAAPEPAPALPLPVRNTLAGTWFYRKPVDPPKNKELYPPEFIETSISEENGQVRGTYRARYTIPDRPVSPDVNFQFAGPVTGETGSVPWSGNGGSKGQVTFRLTADHSLRVDWVASQLGNLGFYKGTALLVRKSD